MAESKKKVAEVANTEAQAAEDTRTVADLERELEEKEKQLCGLGEQLERCAQALRGAISREEKLHKIVKAQAELIEVLYYGEKGES